MIEPAEFWTGSMITAATVRRVLVANDRVHLVGALKRARVLLRAVRAAVAVGHRRAEAPGQERFELRPEPGLPLIEIAPIVVPWYALRRVMNL